MKQFTIGDLIRELEFLKFNGISDEAPVYFDFGNFFSCALSTWRGDGDEMALEYTPIRSNEKPFTIDSLISLLKNSFTLGYSQYKGNDTTYPNTDTKLWIANWGELSYTAIYKVSYTRGLVYLHTYLVEE
jgi:hypothetical protein